MNKRIKSAFMKRSRMGIPIPKTVQITVSMDVPNNFVSLLRKTKKNNSANLNERDLNGNKKCWRTVKPLLSHKIKSSGKISLVEQKETS